MTTLDMWRNVREAYREAFQAWIKDDYAKTIIMLRLAIDRSEILIKHLKNKIN